MRASPASRGRLGLLAALLAGRSLAGCSDSAARSDAGTEAALVVDVADGSAPDVTAPDVTAPDVTTPDATTPDVVPMGPDASPDVPSTTPDVVVPADAGPRLAAWSRRYGDRSDQDCFALALDPADNVYLSNFIIGTVDFGNGPLSGMDRIAIAKLGPTGEPLWSRIYPNGRRQYSTGIAVAPSGAIVIQGGFEGTLNFGGAALVSAGGDDIFSAGLTAAGATSWSHRYGDAMLYQKGLDVATDRSGNAVFVGEFTGSVDFGGMAFTGTNRDAFVVKLDAGGNHLWSRSWGDGSMQVATGVAVDGEGNVIVSGRLDGRIDFGGGPIGSGVGFFLTRLTPAGAYSFARAFPTSEGQVMKSRVAVDAAGNIYLAGAVIGAVDFGGGMIPGRGDFDAFVVKFDPTGRLVWHREFGDAMMQQVTDIAVDGAGNIALTGLFDGTVDFGGGALTSLGGDDFVGGDAFVVRLNPDGSHRFSARYGDSAAQRGQSVAIDARGDVVVAGVFRGTMDLGTGPLTSAGGTDIFVARIQTP